MVLESLDKLIGTCEARSESMVVEGVHLSLNAVMRLMQKHPSIVPFLVHISNEAKHRERFAVRSLDLLLASGFKPSKEACKAIGGAYAENHNALMRERPEINTSATAKAGTPEGMSKWAPGACK